MKTAMQELIEFYEQDLKATFTTERWNKLKAKKVELLEKEKNQIIDSHREGQADLLNPEIKEMTKPQRQHIAEQYFLKLLNS